MRPPPTKLCRSAEVRADVRAQQAHAPLHTKQQTDGRSARALIVVVVAARGFPQSRRKSFMREYRFLGPCCVSDSTDGGDDASARRRRRARIEVAAWAALAAALLVVGVALLAVRPVGEGVEAGAWCVAASVVTISLASDRAGLHESERDAGVGTTSATSRRDVTRALVCALFVALSLIATASYAAAAASPFADARAMGGAVVATLTFAVLALFRLLRALDSRRRARHGRDSTARVKRALIAAMWLSSVGLVAMFAYQAAGYARDLYAFAPPDAHVVAVVRGAPVFDTPHRATTSTVAFNQDVPDATPDAVKRLLHWQCDGAGSPTVLLAHGHGGTLWDWSWVQRRVATRTRVCSFSRFGYGYSSRGVRPRHQGRVASEVKRVLDTLNVTDPLVLVGFSLGGLWVKTFYAAYGSNVVGMVYADAVNPACFRPCSREGDQLVQGSPSPLLAALAPTGLIRALVDTNNLPLNGSFYASSLPSDVVAPRRATFSAPTYWQTDAEEEISSSCAIARDLDVSSVPVPVTSLVAERGIHATSDPATTLVCGAALANQSASMGRWVLLPGALHLDVLFVSEHANVVADEIVRVVEMARRPRRR